MKGRVAGLALLMLAPAATAGGMETCRQLEDPAARLACFDALPDTQGENGGRTESFPLRSRLLGKVVRWEKGTRFRLENGQVWKSVDDQAGYYPAIQENAQVTVDQTWFGAYWLGFDGVEARVRVKRIK